jgi:hypothetical protein
MHLCLRITFPSKKHFFNELLPELMEKTKQLYVLPTLVECYIIITNLDMWM